MKMVSFHYGQDVTSATNLGHVSQAKLGNEKCEDVQPVSESLSIKFFL